MILPSGLGTWLIAALTSVSVIAQPVAPFFAPSAGGSAPASSVATSKPPLPPPAMLRQILDGPDVGQVTLIMDRPFADSRAQQLSDQLGTDIVTSYPAFGQYVLALPRIEITTLDGDSGVVYFPKLASGADVRQYLSDNQLTVKRWLHNPEFPGRFALVTLPRIQLQLIDPLIGMFRAKLPRNLDLTRLSAWANSINFV